MEKKINELYKNSMLGLKATRKNASCTVKILKTILEDESFKNLSVDDALRVLEDCKTLLTSMIIIR